MVSSETLTYWIENKLPSFRRSTAAIGKKIIKGSRNAFSLETIWFQYFIISLEPLLVLIEYVPFGDLLGYLRKSRGLNDNYFKDPDIKPQTNLTSQQLMKFAWQIADGMSYLSSKSVSWIILQRNSVSKTKQY